MASDKTETKQNDLHLTRKKWDHTKKGWVTIPQNKQRKQQR